MEPLCFQPYERLHAHHRPRRSADGPVPVDDPGLNSVEVALGLLGVFREYPAGESVFDFVGDAERLIEVLHLYDGEHRDEELLQLDPVASGDAVYDGRGDIVAVRELALSEHLSAAQYLAVLRRVGNRASVFRQSRLVDDGPHEDLLPRRIADDALLSARDELFDELPMDCLEDYDPAGGAALLSAEPECTPENSLDRFVQVGLGSHDGGVLSSHLCDEGLRALRAELEVSLRADVVGACEGDPLDLGVAQDRVAYRAARSRDQVQDARG